MASISSFCISSAKDSARSIILCMTRGKIRMMTG